MARDKDDFDSATRLTNKLADNGIHFLVGEIESANVTEAIKWLCAENLNPKPRRELTLYISSDGGDLYEAFALIDAMEASSHAIKTVGIGSVMSAAFLIFTSGTPGKRFIGPYCSLMCHQHTEEVDGKHHDIKATVKESDYCNKKMLEILKLATDQDGRTIKGKLLNATDRYITPDQAIELGVADEIWDNF
jgi:ATP-dependent Clp protease protease subunit